jgi:hypothetical protein
MAAAKAYRPYDSCREEKYSGRRKFECVRSAAAGCQHNVTSVVCLKGSHSVFISLLLTDAFPFRTFCVIWYRSDSASADPISIHCPAFHNPAPHRHGPCAHVRRLSAARSSRSPHFGGENPVDRPGFLAVSRETIVRGSIDVADFTAVPDMNPVSFQMDHGRS